MKRRPTNSHRRRLAGSVDGLLALLLIISVGWYIRPANGHSQVSAPPRVELSGGACQPGPPAELQSAPPQKEVLVPAPVDHSAAPGVSAQSFAVIDASNGRVLYARHLHEHRPPASTTKMMTAILSIESGVDENAVVFSTVDYSTLVDSSVMGLTPDVGVTVKDLLYGLMLPSGNDAAIELARDLAGSEGDFVAQMNAKVQALGLHDTNFANPHGLDDPNHYSSAYDLAMIARYGMGIPRFREIVGTPVWHLSPPFDYDVTNGNSLLDLYPGVDGVKIGWTDEAGWTFVASAQRDGREVIVSLMNTEDRNADASALLDWAFASSYWQNPNATVVAPTPVPAASTPLAATKPTGCTDPGSPAG